jgi:CBS domain-containing protein
VINPQVIQADLTDKVIDLARTMAEAQVSCVVIVQELPQEPSLPVGIITERDLLQFQTLGLDLGKVSAEAVMSTPLFLLNPEDSLWIAHQQMQRRRVRRLVVSWNWGEGIGLVTQTSLLRVFDPMEMYGVIETLQHTVEQLETEKTESSPRPTSDLNQVKLGLGNQPEQLRESQGKSDEAENSEPKAADTFLAEHFSQSQAEFESGLCALQTKLALLASEPEMPQARREQLLSFALADVEELKKIWQKNSSVI